MAQALFLVYYAVTVLCGLESLHAVRVTVSVDNTNEQQNPHQKLDPVTELMVRECVAARAKDWSDLHKRLGTSVPEAHATTQPVDAANDLYRLKDLIAFKQNYIKGLRKSRKENGVEFAPAKRRSERRALKEEVRNLTAEIVARHEDLSSWGFAIDVSHDRCAHGATDAAYDCMVDGACADDTDQACKSLKSDVRNRVDMRDLVAHLRAAHRRFGKKSETEKDFDSAIDALSEKLKAKGYLWNDKKTECRKRLTEYVTRLEERIASELSAGEEVDGVCQEATGKMCPEGTFAITQRRWDERKGAQASGAFFAATHAAMPFLTPLVIAVGTSVGGPAGATIAVGIEKGLGLAGTFAAGFLASRGPLECACFPRDCIYNNATEMCQLDVHDTPSKNPYSATLPMGGTKCALYHKSEKTCGHQQCTGDDYSIATKDSQVFGTLGSHSKGVYNCLSKDPSSSGALSVASTLPDGQLNTIDSRNELYGKLLGTSVTSSIG